MNYCASYHLCGGNESCGESCLLVCRLMTATPASAVYLFEGVILSTLLPFLPACSLGENLGFVAGRRWHCWRHTLLWGVVLELCWLIVASFMAWLLWWWPPSSFISEPIHFISPSSLWLPRSLQDDGWFALLLVKRSDLVRFLDHRVTKQHRTINVLYIKSF